MLERKFEPESLRIECFLPVRAHGGDVELGGFVQAGPGPEQPWLLDLLQGGQVLLGLAAEPALLNAEIDELALGQRHLRRAAGRCGR